MNLASYMQKTFDWQNRRKIWSSHYLPLVKKFHLLQRFLRNFYDLNSQETDFTYMYVQNRRKIWSSHYLPLVKKFHLLLCFLRNFYYLNSPETDFTYVQDCKQVLFNGLICHFHITSYMKELCVLW